MQPRITVSWTCDRAAGLARGLPCSFLWLVALWIPLIAPRMPFGPPESAHGLQALAALARFEAIAVLSALAMVVAYQALRGRIALRGLLDDKTTGRLDPGRIQMLVATLLLSGALLMSLEHGQKSPIVTVPSEWLVALFGGSQGVYLVRKALQVFLGKRGV